MTQQWDCKKCGERGNIYKLLAYLGKTYLLEGATIKEVERIVSIRSKQEEKEEETVLETLPEVKMPVGWKVVTSVTPYIRERRLTAADCSRYLIGMTSLYGKLKNYLVIPVMDDGKVRGYVGRYASKKVPEDKLRYNNSVGTKFGQLLYGYDDIIGGETSTVILVEGIFDKIAVDKVLQLDSDAEVKCVCTFGKKISPQQIEKLKIKGVSKVVLLYDFDALRDIRKIGVKLDETFSTYIVYTQKKDIDECTPEEALAVFQHPQRPIEFNESVIGKMKRK